MNEQKKLAEQMESTVAQLMGNRRRVLNPFKLHPVGHILTYALSRKEWAALKYLLAGERFREAFSHSYRVEVRVPLPHRVSFFSLSLPPSNRVDGKLDWPDITVQFENLPNNVQDYILQWAEYDYKLADEQALVTAHVNRALEECNTWGQLRTVWPALISLFPAKVKQKALASRARSKLPESAYEHYDSQAGRGIGHATWADPKRIDESQMFLSEALLLPHHEEGITNQTPQQLRYRTFEELNP